MGAPVSKDGYEEVQKWDDDGEGHFDAGDVKAVSAMSPAARENAATELGGFVGEARNQAGLALPLACPWCATA